MEETYDVIVLGTGLVECVLSGLLSVDGKKVLHMDRNDFYGGESASLNLEQMWKKFRSGAPPDKLGRARDYNIDMIPKFIMARGNLVKLLLHCGTERYLEFKVIEGSYVYKAGDSSWKAAFGGDKKAGQIFKVPATEGEAVKSSLLGLLEKKRFKDFLSFAEGFKPEDKKTHGKLDMSKATMADVFKHFSLSDTVQDFVGHALALYTDNSFIDAPAAQCFQRIELYGDSLAQFGKSPYIYPLYGLGELPQAFARLAAIYGGTYMLNKPIKEVVIENGQFVGVRSTADDSDAEVVVKAKLVVGDPSYFQNVSSAVKPAGQVVRAYCVLSHPIPDTHNAESVQIIIPQNQVGRGHDIYVACVSHAHSVAPAGKWIAIVSTTVETKDPQAELKAGLDLLGPIDEVFYDVANLYAPDNKLPGVFVSNSYDAQSHFESASLDIMRLYKEITGNDVDLTPKKDDE